MIITTSALIEELNGHFQGLDNPWLITGIGKINAAYSLTNLINHYKTQGEKIEMVLNFGTAASAHYPKDTIVQCNRFYQRDMKCDLKEYHRDNSIELSHISLDLPEYQKAVCYTGDSFLNYFQCQEYQGVVDMEAFALKKVCRAMGIDFYCFKAVTDGYSHNSEKDWRENLNNSAKEFRQIYERIKDSHVQLD